MSLKVAAFPSWTPRELSPQASSGLTTVGPAGVDQATGFRNHGKIISLIFQSLRGKSNFNPVMCLDSGSLLQISTHDDHHQCQSECPQILKYFHIFEATEREGWLLLGQLELISVVNKDKTAEPRDIISFTNHLVGNNRPARKEAFRETETVGSLEAQSVPWKLWENVGSLNYQIIYLLVSVRLFFLLKMCPWLPPSPPHQLQSPMSINPGCTNKFWRRLGLKFKS